MQTVTARFLQAVRYPHAIQAAAVHRNLVTGVETTLQVEDGTVTIDATSNVRRQLALTVPADQATWDALDTVGGEITVTLGIGYVDRSVEMVPMGVFVVDTDQIGYGPDGTIQMTCPDRWVKVQRNKLAADARASVPGNSAWREIQRLVEGAWPGTDFPFPGWATVDESATTKVGALLWDDGDREAAVNGIAQANSLEVFFDATGLAVLRPVPVLTDDSDSVWTVDAGISGVMISADRSRDRSRLHNVIIVSTSATDVTFTPVEVTDDTPGDPLNTTGPLGYVALEYSAPTLRNSSQARDAGRTMLRRNLGVAKQLTLEALVNPALDVQDVISVVLPQLDRTTPRATELHILDTVTTPLTPAGTQQIATRSTRPDTDGT